MGSFLGYAAYYLVRKNLSLAAPDMIAEGLADKFGIGVAASALSIAYAFSKFGMGMLSDRSDARKFLTVGLVVASLVMMAMGLLPYSASFRRRLPGNWKVENSYKTKIRDISRVLDDKSISAKRHFVNLHEVR